MQETKSSGQKYLIYLQELRIRLFKICVVLFCVFAICFYYANQIYSYIAAPLSSKLNDLTVTGKIISTEITSTFWIPTKLALITSFIISTPWIALQCWWFISPALHRREQIYLKTILISSLVLFYCGLNFGYWILCPTALQFFLWAGPIEVYILPSIQSYLDFILALTIGAGIGFQMPLIIYTLIYFDIISVKDAARMRSYIVLLIFVVAMFLTPPDVISQILLALPLWGLFELTLLGATIMR